jgi:hypothetical protein
MERPQFLQSTTLGAAATILVVAPPAAAAAHVSFLQENVMSDPIRPYEPLTSENAALVLVDHQIGLMTGVRDYSTGELEALRGVPIIDRSSVNAFDDPNVARPSPRPVARS